MGQSGVPLEGMEVTMYLEFFLVFSSFLLFLLTFKFLSSPFLLHWGRCGIPLEGAGITTYLKRFLSFSRLLLFLAFVFLSPLFPL